MDTKKLREDGLKIISEAIQAVLPDKSVKKKLRELKLEGNLYLLAIGKASWRMAKAVVEELGKRIKKGVVITKYGHSFGDIPNCEIYECGHPIPDENTLFASRKALKMVESLTHSDTLLFLVSGGGSTLFEIPYDGITLEELKTINNLLLISGASISEMNVVRKKLSKVKGGKLALIAYPAKVVTLALSDVLNDDFSMIASGPTYPDLSTPEEALGILDRYGIVIPKHITNILKSTSHPSELKNVEYHIVGSLRIACERAERTARDLGYNSSIISTFVDCEAREAGKFLGSIAKEIRKYGRPLSPPCVIVAGGETVVRVKGKGKGGRNQEVALSAAITIEGLENVVILSFGTDGTDGPTDAAGGIVDGQTAQRLKALNMDPMAYLNDNDSYTALKKVNALLITGPTGTNVNDLMLVICG